LGRSGALSSAVPQSRVVLESWISAANRARAAASIHDLVTSVEDFWRHPRKTPPTNTTSSMITSSGDRQEAEL
jgi:hypothetical protein